MEFITIKGECYRYPLLDRVLAVLNYHKNSAGDKLPDMGRDGFAYKSIKLKDDIQNGPLLQHEVVIEVDTMNVVGQSEINLVDNKINLMVLIFPFKTLDYIVCKIPLVSNSWQELS